MKGVRYKPFKGQDILRDVCVIDLVSIDRKQRIREVCVPSNRSGFLIAFSSDKLAGFTSRIQAIIDNNIMGLRDVRQKYPNMVLYEEWGANATRRVSAIVARALKLVVTDGDKGWLPLYIDVPMPIQCTKYGYRPYTISLHKLGDLEDPRNTVRSMMGKLKVCRGRRVSSFTMGKADRRLIRRHILEFVEKMGVH